MGFFSDLVNNLGSQLGKELSGVDKNKDKQESQIEQREIEKLIKELAEDKQLSNNATKLLIDNIKKISEFVEQQNHLESKITAYQNELSKTTDNAKRNELKANINRTEIDRSIISGEFERLRNRLGTKYATGTGETDLIGSIGVEEYEKIFDAAKKNKEAILEENESKLKQITTSEKLGKVLSSNANGFDIVSKGAGLALNKLKELGPEFAILAELVKVVIDRLVETSDKLVKFNRDSGLGMASQRLLGMDIYGNSINGSLPTIANNANLSQDQLLSALGGFRSGNTIGLVKPLEEQQSQLVNFAVTSAQISKNFGVAQEQLNKISNNLTYGLGMSVAEVNKTLSDGAVLAMTAGVNMGKFFDNLEQATNEVNKHFIAGGTEGLQRLALVATRFNTSVDAIFKTLDKYKTITSSFQEQANAAQFGLQNLAANSQMIWALSKVGRQDEAKSFRTGAIAKDILASGGDIDNPYNIARLNAAGVDPKEIEEVRGLLKESQSLGISIDKLMNKSLMTDRDKALYDKYKRDNMTVSERFIQLWDTIKNSIIDPLASVITPMFKSGMEILTSSVSMLGKILKPFIAIVQALIRPFSLLLDKISDWANTLDTVIPGGTNSLIGNSNSQSKSSFIPSSVGLALMLGLGNKITKKGSSLLGKALVRGGEAVTDLGIKTGVNDDLALGAGLKLENAGLKLGSFAQKGLSVGKIVKGGLIGAGISLGSSAIGGLVGGQAGEKISTVGDWAGTGASIGTMFGPWGTLIGAGVGALGGAIKSISDNWSSQKGFWQNISDWFTGDNMANSVEKGVTAANKKDENFKIVGSNFFDTATVKSIADAMEQRRKRFEDSEFSGQATLEKYNNAANQTLQVNITNHAGIYGIKSESQVLSQRK